MKKILGAVCALAVSCSVVPAFAQHDDAKMRERLSAAAGVLNEVQASPDKSIPQSILASARCVVVVPGFKKAAFAVGAQYGQGVATCRTPKGWSAPVFVRLSGASFGFQIGGQSTDLVLLAMNEHGMDSMLKSKFKLGADAAASAGPVGRNAQAATDVLLNAEFLTYSRSKGLFAGVDLTGDLLDENEDDTNKQYGADVPYQTILKGNVPVPAGATRFVSTVAKYFVVAKNQ